MKTKTEWEQKRLAARRKEFLAHAAERRKYGRPRRDLANTSVYSDTIIRDVREFAEKSVETTCVVWMGFHNVDGIAIVRPGQAAHRVLWRLEKPDDVRGNQTLHRYCCDPWCVSPGHHGYPSRLSRAGVDRIFDITGGTLQRIRQLPPQLIWTSGRRPPGTHEELIVLKRRAMLCEIQSPVRLSLKEKPLPADWFVPDSVSKGMKSNDPRFKDLVREYNRSQSGRKGSGGGDGK